MPSTPNSFSTQGSQNVDESLNVHWLPGLHTRYKLDHDTSLRAAWTNTVVRPNFDQLSPAVTLASTTEASLGNPALNPMRAHNLDVGVEQLLGNDGAVSAYVFHKDIKDFTYATNLAGTGPWTGYTSVTGYANGPKARVQGLVVPKWPR